MLRPATCHRRPARLSTRHRKLTGSLRCKRSSPRRHKLLFVPIEILTVIVFFPSNTLFWVIHYQPVQRVGNDAHLQADLNSQIARKDRPPLAFGMQSQAVNNFLDVFSHTLSSCRSSTGRQLLNRTTRQWLELGGFNPDELHRVARDPKLIAYEQAERL